MFIGTFNSSGDYVPHITFVEESFGFGDDYTLTFGRNLLIGDDEISDNLINPYENSIAFDEFSDYSQITIDSELQDVYSVSYNSRNLIGSFEQSDFTGYIGSFGSIGSIGSVGSIEQIDYFGSIGSTNIEPWKGIEVLKDILGTTISSEMLDYYNEFSKAAVLIG